MAVTTLALTFGTNQYIKSVNASDLKINGKAIASVDRNEETDDKGYVINNSEYEFGPEKLAEVDFDEVEKKASSRKPEDYTDEYIREACAMICRVFKHSPVYRVGGDEFSVVLKGEDYENRVALLGQIKTQVEMNKEDGKVVISIGISDYDPDNDKSLSDVFERADREMYANKKELKS